MVTNKVLVSSDHHANWDALEKLFEYAKTNQVPFIINGDVIGDYNFEELAKSLDLKFPYEITSEKLKQTLSSNELQSYATYQQIAQAGGDINPFLNQIPNEQKDKVKEQLLSIVKFIESKEFQEKLQEVSTIIEKDFNHIISQNKIKLRALYNVIIEDHARILANLIDKYEVETYFLNGNHEPIYFPKTISSFLENKTLLKDLGEEKGILNINGIKTCAVSNVNALMPFLSEIYSKKELDKMFSHQRGKNRKILYKNISKNNLTNKNELKDDIDWIRIMPEKEELDLFLTHGQIGRGAWRDDRQANEMPTLYVAAMLSSLAKITIDGHLHTTYEMSTPFETPLIRAVGNKGYLLEKKDNKITYNLVEVEGDYNHKNGHSFENKDLHNLIMNNIFKKK